MNNGTETPITKCSHADAIGNKQIFFMPAKKKSVEVGCTLSKKILLLTKRLIENSC